jgi:hypothetical protein
MADDIVAGWERKSLYYYPQSAWGTYETSVNFNRIRESSRSFPYVPAPVVAPADGMGRGLPFADEADFYLGRPGGSFQTTHPMTPTTVRDLLMLLFNGHHYDVAATERIISPTSVADVVVWTPTLSKFASLCVLMDSDSDPISAIKVTSAVVSQLDFNWPQNTPGDTSGLCEITPTWIFENSARATTGGLGTVTEDAGIFQFTKDWTFKIGANARDFVSGNLSLTNGATLDATAAATAPGAHMGKLGLTGSVTCYLNQDTGSNPGATTDDLMDLLEGASGQPSETVLHFVWHDGHASDDDVDIELPVVVSGPPTLSDLGGIAAMTFNFQMAGDADSPPRVTFHDVSAFDAGLFN